MTQGSIDSVKRTFFTDDLIKQGSYISLKSSPFDFLNAVCSADCHNGVNADDEFLLCLRDNSGVLRESKQPRLRVINYMQQYLTGNLEWQEEIDWKMPPC